MIEVRRPVGDDAPTAALYYGESCLQSLRKLPDHSVQCVVTSPPYWGLRNYQGDPQIWNDNFDCDHEWGNVKKDIEGPGQSCQRCDAWLGQLGLEPMPQMFVAHLVEVFREVWRVLRDDGTFWLNLGDSYASIPGGGLKSKDLVGIPWRVAFALQEDGWYLRSDIVWQKMNPMPESVRDRPTRAHEYIFLLTKRPKYFYDHEAIKEPLVGPDRQVPEGFGGAKGSGQDSSGPSGGRTYSGNAYDASQLTGRNKRSVWTVNTKPYKGAHFAVFSTELITPCVLAGTSEKGRCPMCGTPWERHVEREALQPDAVVGDGRKDLHGPTYSRHKQRVPGGQSLVSTKKIGETWHAGCGCPEHGPVPCTVLDPFSGSATTGVVALDHGRAYVGLDVNESYADLAVARLLGEDAPTLADDGDDTGILEFFGVEGE